MKKSFVLMAMAGVALASCVNDVADVAQKEQKKVKIAFESPVLYDNAESRANVYGEISAETVEGAHSYPKEEDFVIYAVQHDGNLTTWEATTNIVPEFNATAIVHDDDLDGWAPKTSTGGYYFWPGGNAKMSFAATSPADLENSATRSYGDEGLVITNFTIPSNAAKHYDLLFSNREVNKTSNDMIHTEGVWSGLPLFFNHALSSIRFSLKNSSAETVILKKITLFGAQYKGNFIENIKNQNVLYDRTDINVVDPRWTCTDDKVAEEDAYLAFEGEVAFTSSPKYVAESATGTDVCNILLLMPQELSQDVKIHVEYTVNGQLATKTVKVVDAQPQTATLDAIHKTHWVMGYRYTYRLHYSVESSNKDKIYFAPTSDDWKDADIYEIELL